LKIASVLAPSFTNALTIDVEDYFQVSAFARYIRRDEWDARECRVERNVERILQLLAERDVKRHLLHPGLDRASATRRSCSALPPAAMNWPAMATATSAPAISAAKPLHRTCHAREEAAGRHHGHGRAWATVRPAFPSARATSGPLTRWRDAGYRYSSSIYPIQHDHYGMPDSPRFAYRVGTALAGGAGDHPAHVEPQPAPAAGGTSGCCPTPCRAG
jgi:hypothetical protein